MSMFGAIPGGMSANPDWLKQFQAQPETPLGQQPLGAQPPQTSGMFGAPQNVYGPVKGTTSEKLMALGGIFNQLGGVRNDAVQQYFATLDGRREQQRQEQLAEAARFGPQKIGDNIVRMKPDGSYETLYSAPVKPANNDTLNDYELYKSKYGEAWADNWLKFNAANVRQPDGTYVSASNSFGVAPLPALPPGVTVDPQPMGGSAPKGPTTFPSSVMDGLIGVESGGQPGILGPMTKYGQAQGMTQMLPGTAQDMARKLGVAWRPDLMTGTTKEAADYQRQLGQAYLEQGLQVTGNLPDALKYYHGGPDRSKWGPKTRAYSAKVLSRAGIR